VYIGFRPGEGGRPGGKSQLGRSRCIWEGDIKLSFRKWDVGAWTGFIWLRIGIRIGRL
jgi:hypothetical protein